MLCMIRAENYYILQLAKKERKKSEISIFRNWQFWDREYLKIINQEFNLTYINERDKNIINGSSQATELFKLNNNTDNVFFT